MAKGDDERERLKSVLRAFQLDSAVELRVIAGGLSGGEVRQVGVAGKEWGLRRYPAGFSAERVRAIHEAALHRRTTCLFLPRFGATALGTVHVDERGYVWELAEWMPGKPMPAVGWQVEHLRRAIAGLARWHEAGPMDETVLGMADGVRRRREEWARLAAEVLADRSRLKEDDWSTRVRQAIGRVASWFDELREQEGDRRLCLRDGHREHFLMSEGELTGLIDLGALGWDRPVVDVARLLGSFLPSTVEEAGGWEELAREWPTRWGSAREARVLAMTGDVIALLHWYEWLHLRPRSFARRAEAEKRSAEILVRVEEYLTLGGE